MSRVEYKLLVQRSNNCRQLLLFFDRNIETIYHMGALLNIVVIDPKSKKALDGLEKVGINRLPATITPSGKKIIGGEAIKKFFADKIQNQQPRPAKIGATDFGNNPDLAEMYREEMQIGKQRNEQEPDGHFDFGAAMRKAEERAPQHRVGGGTGDQRVGEGRVGEGRVEGNQNEEHQNPQRGGGLAGTYDPLASLRSLRTDNQQDAQMEAAWLQNNVGWGGDH